MRLMSALLICILRILLLRNLWEGYIANRNYIPVDFIVLDIDCNPTCPIILGRPFLRTIGAIFDMKEGNIKFQFPLKKGMEHFPRKKI